MSLEAADKVPLGVAQTLCSLAPVLILPAARLVHHERISPRAVVGAFLAVAGVALLFLPAE
jgi:drug/metabolite transporter (DMT)-like permease